MNLNDAILNMYDAVCFERGSAPDWQRLAEIFSPGVRLVRITDDGIFEFGFDGYRANFEQMIASGQLPSFWEAELWRETWELDDFAHVLSAYETRLTRDGELLNRGVNSIQMFKRDGRWQVSAMTWRRDGRAVRVPAVRNG